MAAADLEEEVIEAHALTWEHLGYQVGMVRTGQNVKNAVGCMKNWKCKACRKGRANEKTARKRKAWAQVMKEKYPKPEN